MEHRYPYQGKTTKKEDRCDKNMDFHVAPLYNTLRHS